MLNIYNAVITAINALLMTKKERLVLAIDGMSASGKTTLSSLLGKKYDANVFHMDDFFLTPEMRTEKRLHEAGGNVDYECFNAEIIKPIFTGEPFTYTAYDCKTGSFKISDTVQPKRVNIVEGAYSMHPYFGDIYDLSVALLIEQSEQKKRILERNGEIMLNRFTSEWIPLENYYIEQTNLKGRCDVIVEII